MVALPGPRGGLRSSCVPRGHGQANLDRDLAAFVRFTGGLDIGTAALGLHQPSTATWSTVSARCPPMPRWRLVKGRDRRAGFNRPPFAASSPGVFERSATREMMPAPELVRTPSWQLPVPPRPPTRRRPPAVAAIAGGIIASWPESWLPSSPESLRPPQVVPPAQRLAVQRCGRRQAGATILPRCLGGDHSRCNGMFDSAYDGVS